MQELAYGTVGLIFLVVQIAILVYVLSLFSRGVDALERISDVLDRRLGALDRTPPEPPIEWPDDPAVSG